MMGTTTRRASAGFGVLLALAGCQAAGPAVPGATPIEKPIAAPLTPPAAAPVAPLRLLAFTLDALVSTVAGAEAGYRDGAWADARFDVPRGIAVNLHGDLFLADMQNHAIRRIGRDGTVRTIAGGHGPGYQDGAASVAMFQQPVDVAVDGMGHVYVADYGNNRIRKITPDGQVSTLAGSGIVGFQDGPGATARFNRPRGLDALDDGTVFVADTDNHVIRKVLPDGTVSNHAGTGGRGHRNGLAGVDWVQFDHPLDVAATRDGTLYVADGWNNVIRKVTPERRVTTFAGCGLRGYVAGYPAVARFDQPAGVAVGMDGTVYVADRNNHVLRQVAPDGCAKLAAGKFVWSTSPQGGYADGTAAQARFQLPCSVAADKYGRLFVADMLNHRIRCVREAGTPSPEDTAYPAI